MAAGGGLGVAQAEVEAPERLAAGQRFRQPVSGAESDPEQAGRAQQGVEDGGEPADGDAAAGRHRIACIEYEVHQDLLELAGIPVPAKQAIDGVSLVPVLKGGTIDTSKKGFLMAMEISVYSFIELAREAEALMDDGGSILTMSYYGAEKVVPNYNIMGPAKASLEANVRFMAADLGRHGIRVNGISAGPIKTLAAAGIAHFRKMLHHVEETTPLRRTITPKEVGNVAAFLCSDMASGVTGEITFVDSGYNILGMSGLD